MQCWRATLPGALAKIARAPYPNDYEENIMNKDIFEGKWKEMRGQVKEWWGKLTDDDLEQAGGNAEQIVGLLQQKYGYTRERAEEEFNRRIKDVKMKVDKA
jgi:uncharacterized protein YjbJ (UPF0337 family)